MSAIEYNNLLFQISKKLDELKVLEQLLFMCRGKLAYGSEDNIQDVLSLFKELEEQNNLGIDRLEEMKELLKGVDEWSLFGKVRKFECKRKEYYELLEHVIPALDELNDLERLITMCKGKISEESEGHIQDVRSLIKELENQNNLGTHRLVILKGILTELEKNDLVKEVEEFEERRNEEDESERKKEQRGALVSSIGNKFIGSVKLVCNFCTTKGLLVVNSAMALRKCCSPKEYMDVFKEVVLVSYNKLVGIREGSLCFIVQAGTPSALNELWDIYKSGTLQARLQEFLVTEEIKQLASGEDVEVTVYIDEQEYKEAFLDLLLLERQASQIKQEGRLGARPRRNSDSFLCFKPNEVESATLMRLKHAENKWIFEWQLLEQENENLRAKITEAESLKRKLFSYEEECAQETEDIERPRKRRQRYSDSILYCKAREGDVRESNNEEQGMPHEEKTKYLDAEREAFVQSYLQSIPAETGSITTETSDSGVRAHGTPSDLGEMENFTDFSQAYVLKDLSGEVIRKLQRALEVDEVARQHIYHSFGIKKKDPRGHFYFLISIFEFFPDTPVKLLRDVFEALQLYDLVDLLSEKPKPVRSLRLALPLQEIEKLRKAADNRPTTYHRSVAVLIIADELEEDSDINIEELKNFFKDLNSKSDITIIKCGNVLRAESDVRQILNESKLMAPQKEKKILEGLRQKTQKKKEEMKTELDKMDTAASAAIDRWMHNQGDFSLFAVFVVSKQDFGSMWTTSVKVESLLQRLVSGIPDKIKYIVGPRTVTRGLEQTPETLLISYDSWFSQLFPASLILKILTKRWQTLDLTSMMKELKRTSNLYVPTGDEIMKDRLSSLPRFKKEEDLTD